jgi:UDP-N-acetylmuramyl pentapeptide phosphotransferase/UDP-N-acetylglucosamine-1-phosphate transferase
MVDEFANWKNSNIVTMAWPVSSEVMGDTGSLGVHAAAFWLQVRHTTNIMSIIHRSSLPLVNTVACILKLLLGQVLTSGSNLTQHPHQDSSTLGALEWMIGSENMRMV